MSFKQLLYIQFLISGYKGVHLRIAASQVIYTF